MSETQGGGRARRDLNVVPEPGGNWFQRKENLSRIGFSVILLGLGTVAITNTLMFMKSSKRRM